MVHRVIHGRRWRSVSVVLLLAYGLGACATRQPTGISDKFVQKGEESEVVIGDSNDVNTELYDRNAKPPRIEDLEVERPEAITPAATRLEDADPALATALVVATARPSPAAHRKVAELYQGHGIMDMAYDHLRAAERLTPDDAATQDSLARLWRSSGYERIGLGAAYRARYQAPDSPEAHNTLGTLLQAVGHHEAARRSYDTSLSFDPTAGYALNNLCYLAYSERAFGEAAEYCEAAVSADPSLREAHNNLALIYFSTGEDELAWKSLQNAGPIWTAMYNLGMVHMARGNHSAAAATFSAVSRAKPSWAEPRRRAKQAREQLTTGTVR